MTQISDIDTATEAQLWQGLVEAETRCLKCKAAQDKYALPPGADRRCTDCNGSGRVPVLTGLREECHNNPCIETTWHGCYDDRCSLGEHPWHAPGCCNGTGYVPRPISREALEDALTEAGVFWTLHYNTITKTHMAAVGSVEPASHKDATVALLIPTAKWLKAQG